MQERIEKETRKHAQLQKLHDEASSEELSSSDDEVESKKTVLAQQN